MLSWRHFTKSHLFSRYFRFWHLTPTRTDFFRMFYTPVLAQWLFSDMATGLIIAFNTLKTVCISIVNFSKYGKAVIQFGQQANSEQHFLSFFIAKKSIARLTHAIVDLVRLNSAIDSKNQNFLLTYSVQQGLIGNSKCC